MKVKNKILSLMILLSSLIIISVLVIYFFFRPTFDWALLGYRLYTDMSKEEIYVEKDRGIDILNYHLEFDLFPIDKYIKAEARIIGIIEKGRDKIELDFYDNFEITKVDLNDDNCEYEFENKQILLERKTSAKDTFNLSIAYEGAPESRGFGSFEFGNEGKHKVLYTLNEPNFASTWFPCNDTPSDKATYSISITSDSNMISVSNGRLISRKFLHSRSTYNWETRYPIAPYLIAIYSAPYSTIEQHYRNSKNDSMLVTYYVLPEYVDEAKYAFADHPSYIKIFSELFGEYPFIDEKYGVAQIPWQYGAMESQTITSIGSNFISKAGFFSNLLIHEVAHHWWGNAVTPKSWEHIWLNEGFSTYSEALYWEKVRGKESLISTMNSFYVDPNSDRIFASKGNLFSRMIYNKGAWVLHMLRREIGDSLFFNSMRYYYSEFKYSNADSEDFKNIFEELSGRDLDIFFDQWIYKGEGKIEIDYDWETISQTDSTKLVLINLVQKQNGYEKYEFPLDIVITGNNGNKQKYLHYLSSVDTTLSLLFHSEILEIKFDPDNWLLADFNHKMK